MRIYISNKFGVGVGGGGNDAVGSEIVLGEPPLELLTKLDTIVLLQLFYVKRNSGSFTDICRNMSKEVERNSLIQGLKILRFKGLL